MGGGLCGPRGDGPHWRLSGWVPFPSCPMSSPLTFFRTTNSFSAVALRATSSSYLGWGERGVAAERWGLGHHLSFWASLPRGPKEWSPCDSYLVLSVV